MGDYNKGDWSTRNDQATAPYNFVPLSKTVIPAEDAVSSLLSTGERSHGGLLGAFQPGFHSGSIEADLSPISPLFIGKSKDSGIFFSIGGEPIIPGSSLRGMTRTLVQILSWSRFKLFDASRVLYYRGLADRSPLSNEYVERMSDKSQTGASAKYRFKAGYLVKQGAEYYIVPARQNSRGMTFTTISLAPSKSTNGGDITHERLWPAPLKPFGAYHIADVCTWLGKTRPDVVEQLQECERNGFSGGWVVTAGDMVNRQHPEKSKHHFWVIAPPSEDRNAWIEVSRQDIAAHRNDETRGDYKNRDQASVDPLRQVRNHPDLPCFYISRQLPGGGSRVSFGHTGYFRLAYDLTIGEHVPSIPAASGILDLDEAIFGRVGEGKEVGDIPSSFASRVYFEDARALGEVVYDKPGLPAILSSPKPTSFQLYLEQHGAHDIKNLLTYNSRDASLRGYKLYWHRDPSGWRAIGNEHASQVRSSPIVPIVKGTFRVRIRFVNLTSVELGALLTALQLPEGCGHRLGMGKPLGLGSVSISNVTLHLVDRQKRYQTLLADNGFNTGETTSTDCSAFKKAFSTYVLGHLPESEKKQASSVWDTPRISALKTILTVGHASQSHQTAYMPFDKSSRAFKDRLVLPHPDEAIQSGKS